MLHVARLLTCGAAAMTDAARTASETKTLESMMRSSKVGERLFILLSSSGVDAG